MLVEHLAEITKKTEIKGQQILDFWTFVKNMTLMNANIALFVLDVQIIVC